MIQTLRVFREEKKLSVFEATPEVWISLWINHIFTFSFTCLVFFLLPTKGRICLSLTISKHEFIPLLFLVLLYSAAAVVVFVSATLCNRHCYYSVFFILAAVVQVIANFILVIVYKTQKWLFKLKTNTQIYAQLLQFLLFDWEEIIFFKEKRTHQSFIAATATLCYLIKEALPAYGLCQGWCHHFHPGFFYACLFCLLTYSVIIS